GDPLIGFIPDIAKPAFELMANENYAGSDITKRSFDPHAKDYLTYKEKTPEVWKGLAGLMYEYVGLDAHPESYKHYFDAYFGGAWDTGLRTISPVVEEIPLVGDWLKKKELQMFGDKYDKGGIGNTPIGRRFYKDTSEEDWRIPAKMYKIFYEAKYEEDLSKEDVSNFYKFLGQSYNKGLLDKDPKKNLAKLKSKGKKFAETTNSFSQYKSLMKKLSKR
ncbi:MAG: LPD38 domain-containing protein, partial [Candidatus Kariarchaeaceae archaeon]